MPPGIFNALDLRSMNLLVRFIMDFALFSLISIETGIPQNARFRTFLYILVPPLGELDGPICHLTRGRLT